MKKNVLLTIIISSIKLLSLCDCISVNDICIQNNQECMGHYDSKRTYKEECRSAKCPISLNYSCGSPSLCTNTKSDCIQYLGLLKFLSIKNSTEKIEPVKYNPKAKQIREKLASEIHFFKKNIKNCPQSAFVFKPSDVCLSGKNCYYKKFISVDSSFKENSYTKYGLVKTDCICDGQLTFVCGIDYCTRNKKACDVLMENINSTKNIADCGNDFILFEKKVESSFRNYLGIC